MSTYARTWVFLFGLLMLFCGLVYGALWPASAPIVGMGNSSTINCGPAFWEDPNAHVGDRFSDAYYNRVPADAAINARKNAEQQQRCDHARDNAGQSTRNIVAFGAFLIFFAFLRNPFNKRKSGGVSLTEFDRVTRQAQADVDARKKTRADRKAQYRAEYLQKVQPVIRKDQS